MTDLAAIAARHMPHMAVYPKELFCSYCHYQWPCDAARLAEALDDHLPLNPPGESFYAACLCGEWTDAGLVRWADHVAAALCEKLWGVGA